MKIKIKPEVIPQACKDAGEISRDQLAREMHVASTTTFRIEKGDVDPSPRFIAALINFTGKSFEDLFFIEREAGDPGPLKEVSLSATGSAA